MSSTIPPITTLPTLPPSTHTTLLTTLFEPSPHLLPLLSPLLLTSHPSYTSLISTTIRTRLHALVASADTFADDKEILDSVLNSHPRLGEKKEKVGELSGREQGGLRGLEEELGRLNGEYEERFGGLRYVVFVNGRGRDAIMEDMRRRIERGDVRLERGEAVDAMCDIALDRVKKLSGES